MELIGILIIYILSPLETFLKLGDAGTLSKYLGFLLVGIFVLRIFIKNKIVIPKESYFLLAFIFFGLMSGLWATSPNLSISRSVTLVQLFVLYIITVNATHEKKTKISNNIGEIIILIGLFFSIYIIWQVVSLGTINYWTRISISNDVDVNHLASFLIPSFIFSFDYSITKSYKYIAPSVIILLAILVTQSRGAFLAILIAIIIYLLMYKNIKIKRFKLISISIFVFLVAYLVIPDEFTYRIQLMFTDSSVLTSGTGRNNIWSWAFGEFLDSPLFGMGLGNFAYLYRPAHSAFFQILSELGLIGIISIGLFLISLFRRFIRGRNHSIIYIVSISLILMSLTVDIFYQKYLWVILGLCSSSTQAAMSKNNE